LGAKRLELSRELIPKASVVAVLINSTNPSAEAYVREAQEAARTVGQQIHTLSASNEGEIDAAFATLAQVRAEALLVVTDAVYDELIAGSENRRPSTFLALPSSVNATARGQFLVKRTTRRDRMRATLRRVKEELRRRMHEPIPEQGLGSSEWSEASSPTMPCRPMALHWEHSTIM
jgi:hypothetical protein